MEFLVERKKASTALGRSKLPGIDYTLNPYIGCVHACIYCYARLYCDPRIGRNWGKVVVVKENIAEVLAREIARKKSGVVGLSTITDAYQNIEAREGITRRLLEILLENNFKVSIQTKSSLVLRDLDVICKKKELVDVGFTITTLDKKLAKLVEPMASSPSERVRALEEISAEGIRTWIFLGPIIPGISEDSFGEIVEIAKATGSVVYYDRFRVKTFMNSGAVRELAERARKANWQKITDELKELCRAKDITLIPGFGDF